MKKIVALALATLMMVSCFAGMTAAFAASEAAVASEGATYEYDFGRHLSDVYSAFSITNRKNVAGMRSATAGYLAVRMDKDKSASTEYPNFMIEKVPTTDASTVDVVLIKYNMAFDGVSNGKLVAVLSNGEEKAVEWTYVSNGRWNFALLDASEIWGNLGEGVTITAFRFHVMDGTKKGDEVKIHYIKLFADVASAEAAYKADGVYSGSAGTLSANEVFYDSVNNRYYSADPLIELTGEKVGAVYSFGSSTIFLQLGDQLYTPGDDGMLQYKEGMSIIEHEGGYALDNGKKLTPVSFVDNLYRGADSNLYTQGAGYVVTQYAGVYTRLSKVADVVLPTLVNTYTAATVNASDVKVYSARGEREENTFFEVSEALTEIVAAGLIEMDATIEAFGYAIDDRAPIFDANYAVSANRCRISAAVDRLSDGVHVIRFLAKTTAGDVYEIPDTMAVVVLGSAVEKELQGYRGFATDYSFWPYTDGRTFVRGSEFDVTAEGHTETYTPVTKDYPAYTGSLSYTDMHVYGGSEVAVSGTAVVAWMEQINHSYADENKTASNFVLSGLVIERDVVKVGFAIGDGEPDWRDLDGRAFTANVRVSEMTEDGAYNMYFLVQTEDGNVYKVEEVCFTYLRGPQEVFVPETFSYDTRRYEGKTPSAPLTEDPAPVLVLDGAAMNGVANDMSAGSYNRDEAYVTFEAEGADPSYLLLNQPTKVAPYLAICYRTDVAGSYGEIYVGSFGTEAQGVVDGGRVDYIADGEWHVAVVDLAALSSAYDTRTDVVNYLRHDVLAMDEDGAGVAAGASVDVAYYAFFATENEAKAFDRAEEDYPAVYLVTFLNEDGTTYKTVAFAAGATSVFEPSVPAKDGYTGAWGEYTLADADVTVSPVYTEIPVETESVDETEDVEDTETGVTVDTDSAVDLVGCKAVIGVVAVTPVVMGATAVLACRKGRKEDAE